MHSRTAPNTPSAPEAMSLAKRLGSVPHLSALLMKARSIGLEEPEDLEKLAVQRGLRYYDSHGDSMTGRSILGDSFPMASKDNFSNEELSLALLSPAAPYSLRRLRMGAAMLAAEENRPEAIARLARRERSESIIRHIAQCGTQAEPDNPFWATLLDILPAAPMTQPDALPHLTRFVAMTGLSRMGNGTLMKWIRPTRIQGI
jgi:hypothetical protein